MLAGELACFSAVTDYVMQATSSIISHSALICSPDKEGGTSSRVLSMLDERHYQNQAPLTRGTKPLLAAVQWEGTS